MTDTEGRVEPLEARPTRTVGPCWLLAVLARIIVSNTASHHPDPRKTILFVRRLLSNLGGVCAVFLESTRRRELAQLVTDHILGDEHAVEDLTVVHQERVPDEIRHDHGCACPGLDGAAVAGAHLVNLFQ